MKDKTKKKLIYLRYILPPVLMILTLVMMLIPAYLFVVDGDLNSDKVSAFGMMATSYEESRQALFGTAEQSPATLVFSRTLLTLIIVFPLLFAVGLVAAVYSAVVAIKYFTSDDEEAAEKSRTLFITFFPNRICLFAAELLTLPLCLFPYLMSPLYERFYGMNVVLLLKAPEGLIFEAVSLAAILVLTVMCAPMERDFDADIFKKRKDFEDADEIAEDDYTPVYGVSQESDSESVNERNARIRELLSKDKKD